MLFDVSELVDQLEKTYLPEGESNKYMELGWHFETYTDEVNVEHIRVFRDASPSADEEELWEHVTYQNEEFPLELLLDANN